jgi:uncharacterized protein YndB with AHSA1/START domain
MKPIEFELERTIRAPIDQVFARLVDIEGHNNWMADTGSMLKHTRQTSPGEPTVGTTFVDETSQGPMPGEIAEMEAPHTIVYHWWEKSKSGKLKFEGWPSYHLQSSGDSETLVRHRGKLVSYGVWAWANRSGGGSPSRSAPSRSTRSRRPSSRIRVLLLVERLRPVRFGGRASSHTRCQASRRDPPVRLPRLA